MLRTFHLQGRLFERSDKAALRSVLGDAEVMRYSLRGALGDEAISSFIEKSRQCHAEHGVGPWGWFDSMSGELVGLCGLWPDQVNGVEEMSLGYRLARRFWGKGLATEAAIASLNHAFHDAGVASVVAVVEPENRRSISVVERLGFRDAGTTDFHGRPVALYRMEGRHWAAERGRVESV